MVQPSDIRLIIADDHRLVLEALGYSLERSQFNVVAKTNSGHQALRLVEEQQPDILILDLMIPDIDGHEVLKALEKSDLATRVLVLSSSKDPADVALAIQHGAAGYLSKDMEPAALSEAILTIANGGTAFDQKMMDKVMSLDVGRAITGNHGLIEQLTEQEMRVLMLISSGMSNPEAASILGLSPNTIKTHVKNVFQKLGVSDRTSAALWAAQKGLLGNNPASYNNAPRI